MADVRCLLAQAAGNVGNEIPARRAVMPLARNTLLFKTWSLQLLVSAPEPITYLRGGVVAIPRD